MLRVGGAADEGATVAAVACSSGADGAVEGVDEGESEAELRLRLASAESVMRKLYRKTNDLQERLQLTEGQQPPQQAGAASTASASTVGDGGSDGGGDGVSAGEREQALYLLQQKEADLTRMREYTSQLASRLEHLSAEQQRTANVRPSTAGGRGGGGDDYRVRYMRMRGEYRQLLRSRTDSVRRSGRLAATNEHGVLIEQLDTALHEEADLHRQESRRLNEELYLKEKQSCDWYVEKRLLQDRLAALEGEIGQRDELDGKIDGKMLALFNRLKALEDANLKLEVSNEELRAQQETAGPAGPAPAPVPAPVPVGRAADAGAGAGAGAPPEGEGASVVLGAGPAADG